MYYMYVMFKECGIEAIIFIMCDKSKSSLK